MALEQCCQEVEKQPLTVIDAFPQSFVFHVGIPQVRSIDTAWSVVQNKILATPQLRTAHKLFHVAWL